MPEHLRSGQSDPVRGDALPTQSEAAGVVEDHSSSSHSPTRSTAASALAITQNRNQQPHRHQHPHQYRRPQAQPSSAIRLVPVSSTSHSISTADQLPPSPPSTPSQSPPAQTETSGSWSIEESRWAATIREQELRSALISLTTHESNLPDTPDASPSTVSAGDGRVTQQLAVSACDFVKTVLPNIVPIHPKNKIDVHAPQRRGHYIIEDAGLELVHHASVGAVLIFTGPASATLPATAAFSPGTPHTRHSPSLRLSRSSSPCSTLEHVVPRRTLITRIGRGDSSDDKGLRAHILDVLDHATEKLHVDNVIFAVDRTGMDEERFRATVHGLCYVGASIIGHGPHDKTAHDDRSQHVHELPVEGGDVEENLYAPRCVGRNLVLLSVDV